MDFHSSSIIEKMISNRKLSSRDQRKIPKEKIPNESSQVDWVSPRVAKTQDAFSIPFGHCLDSSFEIDCGSSVISLDFGLVSPSKSWCSPPQRIERAQNREWSSPHRVIDRPSPENSPGNWISMKESAVKHSPALVIKSQTVAGPSFICPQPEPSPLSECTYVVPERAEIHELHLQDVRPKRKISVLGDYEPERVISTKKRAGGPTDAVEVNLLPTNDKVRRVVGPSGHVVKISLLDDFEVPVFGKAQEKTVDETGDPADKSTRGSVNTKTTKISTKLSSPTELQSRAKKRKEDQKEEGGTGARENYSNQNQDEDKAKNEGGSGTVTEDMGKTTQKMIQDLEEILRGPKKDSDKLASKERNKEEKSKPSKKLKPWPRPVEDKPAETPEKKRRNVDPKAVQEYIKSQKQKRLEQVKTEKKTKNAEKEARKKKLEELRIKTLKLAAQSKKKKLLEPVIKEPVDPGTEDDVTMSLGLKQTKPKVSYNESVSKLKKKATQPKPTVTQVESRPPEETPEEPENKIVEEGEEEREGVKPLEAHEKVENLEKPEENVELKSEKDLNKTLKKLAESLHLKLDLKEKQLRSRPLSLTSKSTKDPLSQVPSQETLRSVKSAPEQNRQLVTVDLETIQTLKSDIKKISENFKVLHEIIVDRVDLGSVRKQPSPIQQFSEPPRPLDKETPDWLKSIMPRAYPYNVFSAFQRKMNLKTVKTPSSTSSTFAEPISNKYESEFEALSMPSDRLRSVKEVITQSKSSSCGTSEENYFTMKDDSGNELSSSILDSEKQSLASADMNNRGFPLKISKASNNSMTSSIITEISSRSIRLATSKGFDSISSRSCQGKVRSERENLVTPKIKLISNDLHQEKLNNCAKFHSEKLNNSEKSYREQKTDSTITELIDNLSESEKSIKSVNEKPQNVVERVEEVHVRRSFFQPEMLHLQFQAELTLLETFQQSLSHFLEAERMKTLSEVNRIVYEKAVNTEKSVRREEQAVQTSYLKDSPVKTTSDESNSVKTEINVEEETERLDGGNQEEYLILEASEKLSYPSKESLKETPDLETSDFGSCHAGISFNMLDRMMKDEELRSEHQLALIRLREKTLNEKVKAELTFLEMKKRALKERGGDEEHNISAIKKKQRGILLKYQSEKEEIERLKKMHKIASEERKIMIKQQKQIQQMQMSTNDMIIKLKKREKSPSKKTPLKPKVFVSSESQSEVPEDIPIVSDSILTESACSAEESRHSSRTEWDVSSRSNVSEDEGGILRRNAKTLQNKVSYSLENFKSKKSQLEVEKYPRKRHSVEELLSWTRRLEEKENHLKELEKKTMNAANRAKSKHLKSLKTSMKDRSTSPFHFQDGVKTVSEVSAIETTEGKKSLTISEAIETNPETEMTEKTHSVIEKIQSTASEDIPEQFSKKISTSRATEYNSESFESPSSSETPKPKPETTRGKSAVSDWGQKGIAIKLSLSPRMQSPRRRYSSGSDDSVNLSHTETASEQSDLESRIAALHEQLRKRKLEAERLRREQKKAQRERLRVKEQSLLKQIQAYDAYIQKKKQELEQEYETSNQTVMKPVIKQPKVAEKSSLKRQEPFMIPDCEKLGFSPRSCTKTKDEDVHSEKTPVKETYSDVMEQVKDTSESFLETGEGSESIKEEIGSKLEEEDNTKATESILEVENLTKENLKSSSTSESFPEHDALEGSQSESEDQSISIKTTLHSPLKQDTEILESPTEAGEEESQNKQSIDEDVYQFDSFESDAEEKASARTETPQMGFESSETGGEVKSESGTVSETIIEEVMRETEAERMDENEGRSEKAEKMADSIIMGLILESLNVFCGKKAEAERKLAEKSKLNLETLSSYLAREIISEAVDDMIKIYNRKDERAAGVDHITAEVRRRISDIVTHTQPPDQKRSQEPATQGVSAVADSRKDSTENAEHSNPVRREKKPQAQVSESQVRSKSQLRVSQNNGETFRSSEIRRTAWTRANVLTEAEERNNEESKTESFTQEWIDDEFGLRETRREAEELRLQQLQIEQEIQQLQAQQEQVPYFYLREIPNKPPPPYTPPGKPLAEIPTSESDMMRITINAVRIILEELRKGKDIVGLEPTREYYGDAVNEHLKCYKFFLFDLSKHIISDLIERQERKTEVLPWMRTRENLSKYKYQKIERTFESLSEFVQKQVSVLFGFGRKVSKESLIVKWIKKKRDHVDEILVGESQEEEAQWTQYDEDQVAVKNEVAMAILEGESCLSHGQARLLQLNKNNCNVDFLIKGKSRSNKAIDHINSQNSDSGNNRSHSSFFG